jgi:hypothetical protein
LQFLVAGIQKPKEKPLSMNCPIMTKVSQCKVKLFWQYPNDNGSPINKYEIELSLNSGPWNSIYKNNKTPKRYSDTTFTIPVSTFFSNLTEIKQMTWHARSNSKIGWSPPTKNCTSNLKLQNPQPVAIPILTLTDRFIVEAKWSECGQCDCSHIRYWQNTTLNLTEEDKS